MAFFLSFSAYGKCGDVLLFIAVSWVTTSYVSASLASWPSSAALGNGCLSSLPLLNVIIALTSSILGFSSLEELTSCTPLGLGCVWEGNFPFSCTHCWLVNLEIEYYRLSYFWEISAFKFSCFWEISECRSFIFLLSVLSTVSIL